MAVGHPSSRQGHHDALLSNITVAYIQRATNFVAGQVFPVVPVEFASDYYLEFPRGYFFRYEVGPRPLGGYSNVAGYAIEKKQYHAEEEGLTAMLDDRERANATPPYDPEASKVRFLAQQHLIHRDRTWAEKFFTPGVWTHEITGTQTGSQAKEFTRFDQADSDPIGIVDAEKDRVAETTGFEPNVIVLGRSVFRALKNHPDIVDRIKYTARGIVTTELLAQLFGVDRVLVPGGVINRAPEGAADDISFILGKNHMLLAYAAENPGIDQPSAGYTFSWRGLIGAEGVEAPVWRGRDDRAHSDWFEVRMAYDQRKVAGDLAVFFADAVTPEA